MKKLLGVIFLGLLTMQSALAALDIELTKGIDSAIPIAVVPFEWQSRNAAPPVDVSKVIRSDLALSGRFNVLDPKLFSLKAAEAKDVDLTYWRKKNVEDVVVGSIQPLSAGQYKVTFSLIDLYQEQKAAVPEEVQAENADVNNNILLTQDYVVDAKDLRRLSHHISDLIYEELTGEKGVFSTRIAYVLVKRSEGKPTEYLLEISDMDGHNARPIVRSDEPIMSPSWSPDGNKVAYVSFENKRPRVFVSNVVTGKRELVTSFPGINGAPAWSPDGKKLGLALSKGRNPNIYSLDLATKRATQLTNDNAINTEPQWSPDGKSIIFTSDRGGSPQIYRIHLPGGDIERVTFDGRYNTTASFSPDGKNLVFLHRTDAGFNIATIDLNLGTLRVLTRNGFEESPSFAPNGRMIVYATQYGGQGVLGMVSSDGRVKLRMPDQNGSVQEPVWSPFQQK